MVAFCLTARSCHAALIKQDFIPFQSMRLMAEQDVKSSGAGEIALFLRQGFKTIVVSDFISPSELLLDSAVIPSSYWSPGIINGIGRAIT